MTQMVYHNESQNNEGLDLVTLEEVPQVKSKERFITRHKVAFFYVIALAWSNAIWIPMALHTLLIIYFPIPLVVGQTIGGASPIGALYLLQKLTKGEVSLTVMFHRKSGESLFKKILLYAPSIVAFPLLAVLASLLGQGSVPSGDLQVFLAGPLETLGVGGIFATIPALAVGSLLSSPILEEPGWRGFAATQLQARFGWVIASFTVGTLWWIWHIPINIVNGIEVSLLSYVGMLGTSFLIDAIFNAAGRRLFAAMLCHAGTIVCFTFFSGIYVWQMIPVAWGAALAIRIVLAIIGRHKMEV